MVIDKSQWGKGPWQTEPDELEWVDDATGLKCRALRNDHMGMWCGYVGVPQGHWAFGWDYRLMAKIEVHGGLTYSGTRGKLLWFFGFDCGHAFDLSPGMQAILRRLDSPYVPDDSVTYRDIDFVKCECAKLASQLKQTKDNK